MGLTEGQSVGAAVGALCGGLVLIGVIFVLWRRYGWGTPGIVSGQLRNRLYARLALQLECRSPHVALCHLRALCSPLSANSSPLPPWRPLQRLSKRTGALTCCLSSKRMRWRRPQRQTRQRQQQPAPRSTHLCRGLSAHRQLDLAQQTHRGLPRCLGLLRSAWSLNRCPPRLVLSLLRAGKGVSTRLR